MFSDVKCLRFRDVSSGAFVFFAEGHVPVADLVSEKRSGSSGSVLGFWKKGSSSFRFRFVSCYTQQLKKRGYLAKGFLQKLLALLFLHCLVVRRTFFRVRQRDAWLKTFWCDNGPKGAQILNCRIGMRRVQSRRGLQCTLHFRRPQKIGGQISDSFPLVLL